VHVCEFTFAFTEFLHYGALVVGFYIDRKHFIGFMLFSA